MNTQTKTPTSNILGATGLSKRALAPTTYVNEEQKDD